MINIYFFFLKETENQISLRYPDIVTSICAVSSLHFLFIVSETVHRKWVDVIWVSAIYEIFT